MSYQQNLNGMKFSARDRDHDLSSAHNCASTNNGWWLNACAHASLNGPYRKTDDFPRWDGIIWDTWMGNAKSVRGAVMKIRPRNWLEFPKFVLKIAPFAEKKLLLSVSNLSTFSHSHSFCPPIGKTSPKGTILPILGSSALEVT